MAINKNTVWQSKSDEGYKCYSSGNITDGIIQFIDNILRFKASINFQA